ncbi:hypothetical protein L210DRAFT_3558242 [Boletus edulis BED1]|uniref:Uncharacterized protein n=1 Tax=Boletus edulis BED1 TaxID=1328754 RepID=A0AAD4BJ07_BOLED|nr:hypothetical protein L210DRAFT_3558242 [Boletus edulis BED1]
MACTRVPIWSIPIERAIPAKRRLCLWTCLLLCFLLCRAIVPLNTAIVLLDTLVTLYFLFAGPLCFWTRSLLSISFLQGHWPLCFWTRSLLSVSFLQGHCASGHARYSLFLFCRAIVLLDTLLTLYFFFCRAIVPLDTVVTITSWTTCDSNPDDRSGMGTSILGTS